MPTAARTAAWRTLLALDGCRKTLRTALDANEGALSSRDRGLCREVVYNVLRHRTRIDRTLERFVDKPLAKTPAHLLAALRVGTAQLLYLDRIPTHSAVGESVELLKAFSRAPLAGVANAVLRKVAARRDEWIPDDTDPKKAGELPLAFSHPRWLTDRWVRRFGLAEAVALCRANNTPPPLSLRINRLRTDRETLRTQLIQAGIPAEPSPFSNEALRIPVGTPVSDIPKELWDRFQIQDEAAQRVTDLLEAEAGHRILDACAAPGGKTTHLAEQTEDRSEILAVDRDPVGLGRLRENLRRLRVRSVQVLEGDLLQMQNLGSFDRILLDAPCSALGVIRRHPDIKWCREQRDLHRYRQEQQALLERATDLLKPGGRLVYAVCSTEPEEGEEMVEEALRSLPLQIKKFGDGDSDRFFRTFPHRHGTDGFFAAILVKDG